MTSRTNVRWWLSGEQQGHQVVFFLFCFFKYLLHVDSKYWDCTFERCKSSLGKNQRFKQTFLWIEVFSFFIVIVNTYVILFPVSHMQKPLRDTWLLKYRVSKIKTILALWLPLSHVFFVCLFLFPLRFQERKFKVRKKMLCIRKGIHHKNCAN